MPRSLRVAGLSILIVGVGLLYWSARDRVALPDVRPFRSLRWWFPWPIPNEFKTVRGYRIEQAGRALMWTWALIALVDLLAAALRR